MAEAITEVYAGDEAVLSLHGHRPVPEALAEARRALEHDRDRAERLLKAFAANNVHVYHQRGVYVARNRRRVGP